MMLLKILMVMEYLTLLIVMVLLVLQAPLAQLVLQDHKEILAHKVILDLPERPDHKVLKVILALRVLQELLALKVQLV